MARVRTHAISVSLDGFSAGPDQRLDEPKGDGGDKLHKWVFAIRFGAEMIGAPDAASIEPGVDDDFLARCNDGMGATIMGRNMFGPVRGAWDTWDGEWNGWWGPEPPYHHATFVLTHHPRPPLVMDGGTTFTFVTDGIESALDQALAAADGADVRIAGGASTVQQFVRAGLLDELNVSIVPFLLGRGERLLDHLGDAIDAFTPTEVTTSPTTSVTHISLSRAQS
jgi:dihydrofolate reductase